MSAPTPEARDKDKYIDALEVALNAWAIATGLWDKVTRIFGVGIILSLVSVRFYDWSTGLIPSKKIILTANST